MNNVDTKKGADQESLEDDFNIHTKGNEENDQKEDNVKKSPIIESEDYLFESAKKVANIIEERKYNFFNFNDFRSKLGSDFLSPCEKNEDMFLDTNSNSKQAGKVDQRTMDKILETKEICSSCPLKNECLAVSLSSPQTTRMSKTERVIPNPNLYPMVMSEYLIFGGLTPQERRIVFNHVCDIIEERLMISGQRFMKNGKIYNDSE